MPTHHYFGRRRTGAASVEFAVMLPFIILLLLGAIDIGRAIHVQHNLVEAARAGCRVFSVQKVPMTDVETTIAKCMNDAGLKNYTVTYSHPTRNFQHLDAVYVTIAVSYDDVTWISSLFLKGKQLRATCHMPGDTKPG
jgi:hypothetical protein